MSSVNQVAEITEQLLRDIKKGITLRVSFVCLKGNQFVLFTNIEDSRGINRATITTPYGGIKMCIVSLLDQ